MRFVQQRGAGFAVEPRRGGSAPIRVVIASLEDYDVLPLDEVDKAVLLIDAPGPAALEDMAKLLRLADAAERIE